MSAESMTEDDVRMDMRAVLGAVLSRWLRILAGTLILVGIAYAILMFVPRMYESQAGILVEPRQNAYTQPTGQAVSGSGIAAEAAVSSQIELIKSPDTLLRVIDQLDLREVPEFNGVGAFNPLSAVFRLLGRGSASTEPGSDQVVLANLLERLTVVRERDSQIISIIAQSRDPQLAADIANAVATAHVQRRAELSLQDTAEASVWLEQEIVKLRGRVSDAETAVAEFKIQNNLITGANSPSLVDQQLSNISAQITNAQERRNTAQSRAALIRSLLESGQPIDGVPDVQSSVVIQQLTQSKAALQGELAQREATLLPNHPTVRALRAQIQELEQQIAVEARRVVRALEVEAQIESDLVLSLQDELARTRITASDATSSSVQLEELEREAAAQRELLESYLLRYRDAIARSDSNSALPDVRVITGAAPSISPASPKVALILAAVAFIALALQVGGIVFSELMSGRALVARDELGAGYRPAAADERVVTAVEEVTIVENVTSAPAPEPVRAARQADVVRDPPEVAAEPSTTEPPAAESPAAEAAAAVSSDPDPAPPTATSDASVSAEATPDAPPIDAASVSTAATTAAPAPRTLSPRPARSGKSKPRTRAEAAAAAAEAAAPLLAPTYEGRAQRPLEISSLSADLALGRSRVVMLAGLASHKDVAALAERLVADAIHNGVSIARVDAGSGEVSPEPGISDLAAGLVSFGDVVHRGSQDGLAEVPWGQQQKLDRESAKPLTLLEALTDIYEAVVVMTGPVGRNSSLSAFSGADCRMVVVGDEDAGTDKIEAALSEAAALGFHPVQFMAAPAHHAEVA